MPGVRPLHTNGNLFPININELVTPRFGPIVWLSALLEFEPRSLRVLEWRAIPLRYPPH